MPDGTTPRRAGICALPADDTAAPRLNGSGRASSTARSSHAGAAVSVRAPATAKFEQRRQALLDAAARRFNAQGLKGTTLADIGQDVGLVNTSVTYYHRRKEDLAVACFEQSIAAHRALAEQAFAQGHDCASRLHSFVLAEARLPEAQAAGLSPPLIEFSDIRALPPAQAAGVFEAYNGLFRAVRALLGELSAAGVDRAGLNARAHLLLSAVHTLRHWMLRYEPLDQARVAERASRLLLHGLAAPAQAWSHDPQLSSQVVAQVSGAGAADSESSGSDVHEAFLRAATELVNEQGYRGASIERISARLQMTKGAIYHHHDTKQDLISACFERSQRLTRLALRSAGGLPANGWQRACALTSALLQLQLSARGPLLRATAISALPDPLARARVQQQAQRLNEGLVGVLVDGMEDGSVRPHDAALAAQLLSCATNAAAELRRWVPGATVQDVDALYARPALCGLLAR